MKKILITSLIFLCSSCFIQKGQWTEEQCRPKNPNFKLLKIPFQETNSIVFKKVYQADNATKALGYGFYADGRMICFNTADGFALKEKDVLGRNWDTAIAIGYWRVERDKIQIEYFACHNNGFYHIMRGEIKGDTLVFYENFYYPIGKEVRKERYILSDMSFE